MNTFLLKKILPFFTSQSIKFTTVIMLLGILNATTASAQSVAYNYNFSESFGQPYTALSPGGTIIAAGTFTNAAANAYTNYNLPFKFHYNGTGYDFVNVSDNGFVVLGTTPPLPTGNPAYTTGSPISTASTSELISCFGFNVVGVVTSGSPEVRFNVIGSAPNRIFVVQYQDVQRRGATVLDGLINMQLRLYETTNAIQFIYRDAFTSNNATTVKAQVGLRGYDSVALTSSFNSRQNTSPSVAIYPSTNASTLNTDGLQTIGVVGGGAAQGFKAGTEFDWTPCFAPTAITAAILPDNSTLSINWTNPSYMPSGGFDYQVNTSNAPNTGVFASGNTSGTGVNILGLTTGVTYYIFIKPSCKSTWITSTPASVVPTCPVASIPYTQDFESVVTPAIPNCNSVSVVSGTALITQNNTSTPFYGFANKNIITNGAVAQNTWYFTQGINFPAAGSYRLTYKYGGSREQVFFEQKMKVGYGASATPGAMTILEDHNSIKSSPITNVINFIVSASGTYYIGFNGYAAASQGSLQLDDINLIASTCLAPTALSSGGYTGTSAIISWTAPASAPASGYQYYLVPTTGAIAPVSTTVPTGTIPAGVTLSSISGLTSSTSYTFWVRSNCGGEFSAWSPSSTFSTPFVPTYCAFSTTSTTSYLSNFTTTGGFVNINNTTTLSPGGYGDYTAIYASQAASGVVNFSLTNNDTGGGAGMAIWIDWNNDGDFLDAGEAIYNSAAYIFGGPATGSFTVPAGQAVGNYRLRIVDDYFATSPNSCAIASGSRGEAEDYTFKVTAAPPALTISGTGSTSICSGTTSGNVSITTPLSNFDGYSWTPSTGVNIVSPGVYNFNPTTTTTYKLTGVKTSGSYDTNFVYYTVTVKPLPTPITITPSPASGCQNGTATLLSATGGIVSGISVNAQGTNGVCENFNSGTGGYTTINNSTLGTPANSAWTLRPSPYTTTTATQTLNSNDASQFYTSDSDWQGSAGTTNTQLISPKFDLTGYTDASLSFWHYYRSWVNGTGRVEISTDNGLTYNPVPLASYSTVSQGGPSSFVNVIINLNAYVGVGMNQLKIRFIYNTQYGYRWCIDNVNVSGSTTTAITWSPTTNLYTNPAATIAYTGTAASQVYVKSPTAGLFTYTATAVSAGCPTTTNVNVTINGIVGGTVNSPQTICAGSPANLTLTGSVGTNIQWQSSNTLSFASFVNLGTNSTTLLSSEMGSLTADKFYRAYITNGTCSAYSTIIKITIDTTTWDGTSWTNGLPSSTKAVVFDGDYTSDPVFNSVSPGDINACSVYILSGAVTFISGHSLIVQNTLDTSGGTLTFQNNASLIQPNNIANVFPSTTVNNTGNITYVRNTTNLRTYDYTYWSSPVAPQTLVALSPLTLSDKYFYYNSSTNLWTNIASNSLMDAGRGYIIRAPQGHPNNTPFIGSFVGKPNNGTIPIQIIGSSGSVNLLGNPYPSALDIDKFITDPGFSNNNSVVDGAIYLWTHNTPITANNYTTSDYAVYTLGGGVGTSAASGVNNSIPSGKVASGQGFFIKGLSDANAYFRNSMRVLPVAGNNYNAQFFRSTAAPTSYVAGLEKNRVWLEIFNNQGAYKQTMVGYIETATNAMDRGFDAAAIEAGNVVSLYSILGTNKLIIQGRALPFDLNDVVPLGYVSNIASTYEIKLSNFDGLFDSQDVYLEDKLLNVIHNLKNSNYSFATNIGTFENRFALRFTNNLLNVSSQLFNDESVVIYKENQTIHLFSSNIDLEEVKIFDIRGSLLYSKNKINSKELLISNLNSTQQVILVSAKSTDGKMITKKIIF